MNYFVSLRFADHIPTVNELDKCCFVYSSDIGQLKFLQFWSEEYDIILNDHIMVSYCRSKITHLQRFLEKL